MLENVNKARRRIESERNLENLILTNCPGPWPCGTGRGSTDLLQELFQKITGRWMGNTERLQISGCGSVLRAGGEAELRPRVGPVCGERGRKPARESGTVPPGMGQRRSPRFLHRLCFAAFFQPLSFQPLSLPRGARPGEGAGMGHRDGAPGSPRCSGLGSAPAGTGTASIPPCARGCGRPARQEGAGPEHGGFNLI